MMMRVGVLGLLLAVAAGCTDGNASCCEGQGMAAAPVVTDLSLFQLEHGFRDQRGVDRQLPDFAGRPTLLGMIFTNCEFACPALISDVRRLMASPEMPSDVQVVLVTMDAARDTPEVLAAFAEQHALTDGRYTLLHAGQDAIDELAAVLGVRIAPVGGGGFSHSNQIALLDTAGEIVFRLQGLQAEQQPLLSAIAELSRD